MHVGWCRYKTARPIETKLRVATRAAQDRLVPSDSGLWCLAKIVERLALNRHAEPRWQACHCLRPGNQIPWPFVQRTAANNIQCPQWPPHDQCLCRCGFWWDRHLATRATDCETWPWPLRPWEIRVQATSAPRAQGTSCVGYRGQRCVWSQFRCQTNRPCRALANPWETNQSGHPARRIRPG